MAMTCFIIQPFDGGVYDKRYREIFLPAVKTSGFEPYRVDEDSSASIPIIEIEKQIEKADVCFADISIDNPNVWCEVGLAIAHKKEICLICSKERTKLPFDVQHRQVIFYSTTAPSDFSLLKEAIQKRLEAIARKLADVALLPAEIINTEKTQSELSNFEIAVIGVLASELAMDVERIDIADLRQAVDKQGYTSIAANAGIRILLRKGFISHSQRTDYNDNEYTTISLTNSGWNWIEANMEKFHLRKESSGFGKSKAKVFDDKIPF